MNHIQLPSSQQTHKSPTQKPKGRANWQIQPDPPSAPYYGHYGMPSSRKDPWQPGSKGLSYRSKQKTIDEERYQARDLETRYANTSSHLSALLHSTGSLESPRFRDLAWGLAGIWVHVLGMTWGWVWVGRDHTLVYPAWGPRIYMLHH